MAKMKMFAVVGESGIHNSDKKLFPEWEEVNIKNPHPLSIYNGNDIWIEGPGQAEAIAEDQRVEEIKTNRKNSGVKGFTMTQINNHIDTKINSITTIASAKVVLKDLFKEIAPFLNIEIIEK